MRFFNLLLTVLVFIAGCTKNGTSPEQTNQSTSVFSDTVTEFVIKVFYETGAEPYTGNIGLSGNDTWDITKESFSALFSTHTDRTLTIPSELNEMTSFGDQGKTTWTSSELIALGESLASPLLSDSVITLSILLIEGKLEGQDSVLGVHFGGYPFAFVFKDVVVGVGGTPASQRYVEQGTIVHEIGHAIGLVNNGLPMVNNHEDGEHPAHTSNENGVMYWKVESADNILDVITEFVTGSTLNLFGAQSLADGRNHHP